jgi:Ca2+-binding RTX toxin-like protein
VQSGIANAATPGSSNHATGGRICETRGNKGTVTMFTGYMFELMSWWLLFGGVMATAFILHNDDDDDRIDVDDSPFGGLDDFEVDRFGASAIGTEDADMLAAGDETPTAMAGLDGDDTITGSRDSDYILGGAGDDQIDARVGIDTIRAGDGDDAVSAGLGTDSVFGDAGDDTLDGGGQNDFLDGGAGNDVLIGGIGPDSLSGGDGDDTLSGLAEDRAAARNATEADEDGPDILDGGDGDDVLWLGMDDIGTGGEGADEFAVDHRGDHDDGVRTITDYNPEEDVITLHLDPTAAGETPPEISQNISEDGADRLISVDGVEVLRVVGAGSGDPIEIETPSPESEGEDESEEA